MRFAGRLGNRARQAHAYRDLGCTYGRLGQLAEARELCTQALDLHREQRAVKRDCCMKSLHRARSRGESSHP